MQIAGKDKKQKTPLTPKNIHLNKKNNLIFILYYF